MVTAHVKVAGRVQGVCFRAEAFDEACRLGLYGWVRNCTDGSVELLLHGDRSKVDEMIRWCHHGPPAAQVTSVDVNWEEIDKPPTDFRIRTTI